MVDNVSGEIGLKIKWNMTTNGNNCNSNDSNIKERNNCTSGTDIAQKV